MTTIFYLVAILIGSNGITTTIEGQYLSINECFNARDTVLVQHEAYTISEMSEIGLQVVCVSKDEEL